MRKVSGKRTAALAVTTDVSITAAFYVFFANCNHGIGLEWAIEVANVHRIWSR